VAGCPWTAGQLAQLRFAQGGDLMWVVHPDMEPWIIRRTGATSWALEGIAYDAWRSIPFFRYAPGGITGTWDGTKLTFSAGWLVAGHAGCVLRLYDTVAKLYRHGAISAVLTASECTVAWDAAPATGQPTTLWEEQAFSLVRGWPRSVALHQQRLVFGGSRDAGDAVWCSAIGQVFNFVLGTALDAEGIAAALGATRVRSISHTVSGPQLTFFTENGVFYVPQDENRVITPATFQVRHIAPYGARDAKPGLFDGGVLFAQSRAIAVRDLVYSSTRENLIADPVSLPATGFLGEITQAAYLPGAQDRAEQYAFFVNAAGRILLFHSIREQEITAWAEWTTAGAFRAVGVAGNRVFVAVERDGTIRLEQFDAALAFDAEAAATTPSLAAPHLAGLEIHGRDGDDYLGSGTADVFGAVTLTRQLPEQGGIDDGNAVSLGLAFEWWIESLPPAFDLPDGSLLRRTQRVRETHLLLWRARSARMRGGALVLAADGFAIGAVPAAADGWWRCAHLGIARRTDGDALLRRRIEREVPMPCGVLAMKREVVIA